ncbi:MAG: hypothetical protein WC003_14305 [Terrimicrobiaceae bacterium]
MSAALHSLASKKIAIARERALKAQVELKETFDLLLRAEQNHHVVFPWSWREYQTRLLDDEQVRGADYLTALGMEATALATNKEVLDKALHTAGEWLRAQKCAVGNAQQEIDKETQNHLSVVQGAINVVSDKTGGIPPHVLLEKSAIEKGSGCFVLGCLLGPLSGFFIGGIVVGSILAGILNFVGLKVEPLLVVMPCMLLFCFFPLLCAYLLWKAQCRDTISNAKATAQNAMDAQIRRFEAKLPKLQQALAKAEALATTAGLAQTEIMMCLERATSSVASRVPTRSVEN